LILGSEKMSNEKYTQEQESALKAKAELAKVKAQRDSLVGLLELMASATNGSNGLVAPSIMDWARINAALEKIKADSHA